MYLLSFLKHLKNLPTNYTGGVDPGLLSTRKVFHLTYDENNLSNDMKYLVPDQVVFAPRDSCYESETQEVFHGTKSYQKKIGLEISPSRKDCVIVLYLLVQKKL